MKTFMSVHALQRSQAGFIMMTAYLCIAVLSLFSLALFARHHSYVQSAERGKNKLIAFNMAEAGVDMAIAQLRVNPNYAGGPYTSLNTPTVRGGYAVRVQTPAQNPNVRIIQVQGFSPDNNPASRSFETRTVTIYTEFDVQRFFDFAVFADQDLQLNGNPIVDSYDSRVGPYNSNSANEDGDIGTNSTSAKSVRLIGNAIVKGDAQVGPGGDPTTVIDTGPRAVISGERSSAGSLRVYTPQSTTIPSSGSLSIQGNKTHTLAAGTYRFDSIKIAGNASLQCLGPVTIYVDGSVNMAGNGVATQNNLPPNFVVYVSGNSEVQLAGNGNFYGAIFAPASNVRNVGNGQIFGAVVSKTYQQSGNGYVHFDEALRDRGGQGNNGIRQRAWNESNTDVWGTGVVGGSGSPAA